MGKKCCVPFCRSGYDKTTAEKSRGPSASSSSSDKSLQNKSGNSAQWGDGDSFSSLVEFRQTTSRSASSTTARGPCTPSSTLPTTASRSSWRPRRRSSSRGGGLYSTPIDQQRSATESPFLTENIRGGAQDILNCRQGREQGKTIRPRRIFKVKVDIPLIHLSRGRCRTVKLLD